MSELLCQSETRPTLSGRVNACRVTASAVLFGVHLCGTHEIVWRQRLADGQRIRIHPDRALPFDHDCTLAARMTVVDGGLTKTCRWCKETKPVAAFRPTSGRLCRHCERHYMGDRARARKLAAAADSPAQLTTEQGALPPDEDFSPSSVPADLPGLPVVPADGEELPSVAPVSEAPVLIEDVGGARRETAPERQAASPLPQPLRLCSTPGCTRPPLDDSQEGHRERWCLECQLEGRAGRVAPWSPPAIEDADRPGRYVYKVEFVCMLCGRHITRVKVADEKAAIQLPPALRCRTCGGAPIRSGDVVREFSSKEPFIDDRPHRGRPTREMVAARAEKAS